MHAASRIIVGVTGSVAAYKAAELVRRLRARGAQVRVVMTEAAEAFVTPLTFQALSGHPVRGALLDPQGEAGMDHITLARWADAVVVAPASADFLARLRAGLADDLLSTLCLATRAPVYLAPAMNQVMWHHPATQDNVATLRGRGCRFIGPNDGGQACGEVGPGRMSEPAEIVTRILDAAGGALLGEHWVITAGPTREPLDPVRFLSNRSSGRMGFALAQAAAQSGAQVSLISGPVALDTPQGVRRHDVETAQQMLEAVMAVAPEAEVFIGCAAVADVRPARYQPVKLGKAALGESLPLARNPDILASVTALTQPPFTVGFAAETDDLEARARAKLRAKNLDMIAANLVGRPGLGFEADRNELLLLWSDGKEHLGPADKAALATTLIDRIVTHREAIRPSANTGI